MIGPLAAGCGRLGFATDADATTPPDVRTITSPRQVATGATMSCAIDAVGGLWCWGTPFEDERATPRPPHRVGADRMWSSIAVGDWHACAISDGTLWCWGKNEYGQLADGTLQPHAGPAQVGAAADWVSIIAAGNGACGLRTDGSLWCWGINNLGQVGDGTVAGASEPRPIAAGTAFTTASLGDGHGCAIDSSAGLWCWGSNLFHEVDRSAMNPVLGPVRVGVDRWRDISANYERTCGVLEDGTARCWGAGLGEVPVQLGAASDWSRVWSLRDSGMPGVCGLRGHSLWCGGSNDTGRFGTGDTARVTAPASVEIEPGRSFTDLAISRAHSCAVRDDEVACTGMGAGGQLGDGVMRWARDGIVDGGPWTAVDVGEVFAVGRAEDGTAWVWGRISQSYASFPFRESSPRPFATGTWSSIDTGRDEVVAVRGDGTLWRWGAVPRDDSTIDELLYSPTQLGAATTWRVATIANSHGCGIHADDTLWCWGKNLTGQVGTGTTAYVDLPVQIGSATYREVSTGGSDATRDGTTCAIRTDASLWCWGDNANGQVGDGTTVTRTAPVPIEPGRTWATVRCDGARTIGRTTDGKLWAWGVAGPSVVPTQLDPGTDWDRVDTSPAHACATKVDGTLWCWGSNQYGQLGDGTTIARMVPTQIAPETAWMDVRADDHNTCALSATGQVRCWGRSDTGALGDGLAWATTYRPVVLP